MKVTPEKAYQDTIQVTMAQGHYRAQPFDEERLNEMDLQASHEIFRDRFTDADDFRFYLVGSFSLEEVKPLVERYLASLPSTGREETWRDVGIRPPTGVIEKVVRKGIEPKSQVRITITGPFEWTRRNRQAVVALTEVMRLKFREVLREDLGGTYGVSIASSTFDRPYEGYRLSIGFGCDPERVDELIATVFSQIDSLKANGIDESYIQKTRETARRSLEQNLRENGYWIRSLEFVDMHDQDPYNILRGSNEFYEQLTPEQIRDAARKYLDNDNYAQFILVPEESTEPPE
jgi:zinc protease